MGVYGKVNLLLLDKSDFISPDQVEISGRRFVQLKEIIKPQPGEFLRAGITGGNVGSAELLELTDTCARLQVPHFTQPPPPPSAVELVCALPRPQTFRKVLHCALTMGVKTIHFIHTRKVEKSYWQSSMLRPEELDLEIRLALEQCGDTIYPEFKYYQRFKPFAEDILPLLVQESALAVFGHPRAEMPLPPPPEQGKILLAVGPEGGFTDYENALLAAAGLLPVTLGCRVLRTEFALAALLAKLS